MAALDFPASPSNGQTYSANGLTYTWDGSSWRKGSSDGGVPSGAIILWYGTVASIPTGWVLCDGSNSTPDLRNKFIIGAHSDSGGLQKTTVTGSSTLTGGSKDAVVIQHNHGITDPTHGHSINDPGHTHTYIDQYVVINNGYRPWPANNNDCASRDINSGGNTTGIAVNANGTGITVNNEGSSGSNANLPPYYALCYIMKS